MKNLEFKISGIQIKNRSLKNFENEMNQSECGENIYEQDTQNLYETSFFQAFERRVIHKLLF